MDLTGIISITGRPGLYKVVAQTNKSVIVESLIDHKKTPAFSTDRISALQDISIYTYEEDIPLSEVYTKMAEKLDCKACISHKESAKKLAGELEKYLPEYDQDRVYSSDIKKLFQWYNLLQKSGYIKLEDKEEEKEEAPEKEVPQKKAKKESEATKKEEKEV